MDIFYWVLMQKIIYAFNKKFFLHCSSVVVDPTNLKDGLHYYEIYGIDCKAPGRGPLFRIPVTIIKPTAVVKRPPLVSFSRMSFLPGYFFIGFDPFELNSSQSLGIPFFDWLCVCMSIIFALTATSCHVNKNET